MTCEQARQLLHAYLDDELDLATAMEMEEHLPGCAECARALAAARVVRGAVGSAELYRPAPALLRERVMASMKNETTTPAAPKKRVWWQRPTAISGIAAMLFVAIGLTVIAFNRASGAEVEELVASHVRSLEANHLLDVESTDQHTVKPWFDGKLEFAPPVVDLAADGFPLIGGRLDYLHGEKAAALIFNRNKHVINLFIWPGNASPETETRKGFNLIRFESAGMVCWAISDLNTGELQQFVDLFQKQQGAPVRH